MVNSRGVGPGFAVGQDPGTCDQICPLLLGRQMAPSFPASSEDEFFSDGGCCSLRGS